MNLRAFVPAAWRLLLALALLAPAAVLARDGPRLLLAGGAVPVCADLSPAACLDGRAPLPSSEPRHRLDAAGIDRVEAAWWHPHRREARDRIIAALRGWHAQTGDLRLDGERLPELAAASNPQWTAAWERLAAFEQARVLEALECAAYRDQVAFADSRPGSGAEIHREFVAMARAVSARERPRILVSTASSRDPYAAIGYYLALYEQAGAEVRWLPLDHALAAAQADPERDCARLDTLRGERWGAQDRARLHPDEAAELEAACRDPRRLGALLGWADGLFLNGGDQSLTRAAWHLPDGRPSALLRQLRARLAAGTLVLGGTSAGSAVQAASTGPMLISGSPGPPKGPLSLRSLPPDPDCALAEACDSIDPDALLYHPGGGLGTFVPGIVDTHFSERGREERLARLLLASGAQLGIGIDENTALRVDREGAGWRMRVVGTGAVSWLKAIGDDTVLWERQARGATKHWPRAARPSACPPGAGPARQIEAGGTGLRDALLAANAASGLRFELTHAAHTWAAGWACAGRTPSERIWVLRDRAPADPAISD
jgi:cyanophycinase